MDASAVVAALVDGRNNSSGINADGTEGRGVNAAAWPESGQSLQQSLPPLSDLVREGGIRSDANVSWMLDFAIIGAAKSGTTSLMNYLGSSDEIFMRDGELCWMSANKTGRVVSFFYCHLEEDGHGGIFARTPDGRKLRTGLKCPKDIATEAGLKNYAAYFPRTDFIVTLRHPVLWFEVKPDQIYQSKAIHLF